MRHIQPPTAAIHFLNFVTGSDESPEQPRDIQHRPEQPQRLIGKRQKALPFMEPQGVLILRIDPTANDAISLLTDRNSASASKNRPWPWPR